MGLSFINSSSEVSSDLLTHTVCGAMKKMQLYDRFVSLGQVGYGIHATLLLSISAICVPFVS
jgi:hypothetical protein